jgi:hypothetical protein
MALQSIRDFAKSEPALGKEPNVRAKIAAGQLDPVIVRLGNRIFIDEDPVAEANFAANRRTEATPNPRRSDSR